MESRINGLAWVYVSYPPFLLVQLVNDFETYPLSRKEKESWTLHVPSEVFNPRSRGTNYLE